MSYRPLAECQAHVALPRAKCARLACAISLGIAGGAAHAVSVTLYALHDTYVSNHPNQGGANFNHGAEPWIDTHTYRSGSNLYLADSAIRFDISAYAGFSVSNGAVRLYRDGYYGDNSSSTVTMSDTYDSWNESTVTYNNAPWGSIVWGTADKTFAAGSADGFYTWSRPGFVGTVEVGERYNVRLLMWGESGNHEHRFRSTEYSSGTTYDPRLTFEATAPTFNASVTVGSAVTINEGQILSFTHTGSSGAYYDLTGRAINVNSGDGQTINITGTFSARDSYSTTSEFTYQNDGTFTNSINGTLSGDLSTGLSGFATSRSVSSSRTVRVLNVAPSIVAATLNGINGDISVAEGSTVAMQMSSTDPGADAQAFTLDGQPIGTGGTTGTRTSQLVQQFLADEGVYSRLFRVSDDDTFTGVTRTISVYNVAPTITAAPTTLVVDLVNGTPIATLSSAATDPGVNDLLTYAWDLDGDGAFDDFSGNTGNFDFGQFEKGIYSAMLRVSDGDGGAAYSSFDINVIPEPAGVSGMILSGTVIQRRRRV